MEPYQEILGLVGYDRITSEEAGVCQKYNYRSMQSKEGKKK